jgi:uncharacterized protein with LGFP repeats
VSLGDIQREYIVEENWGAGNHSDLSSTKDYMLGYTIEEIPECYDAIWKKHQSLGGDEGYLGNAVDVRKKSNVGLGSGFHKEFENGRIFYSENTCAHEVHGEILQKYIGEGAETGDAGYPITDVETRPDGSQYVRFERGWIVWSHKTGANEIFGIYLKKWLDGNEKNLGYPIEDPQPLQPLFDIRYVEFYGSQRFQNGSIFSIPTDLPHGGAYAVYGPIHSKYISLDRIKREQLNYPINDTATTKDGLGLYTHFLGGSIYWSPSTGAHAVYGKVNAEWLKNRAESGCLGYPINDTKVVGFDTVNQFQHGNITEYNKRDVVVFCGDTIISST